jgi:hypothetical protein
MFSVPFGNMESSFFGIIPRTFTDMPLSEKGSLVSCLGKNPGENHFFSGQGMSVTGFQVLIVLSLVFASVVKAVIGTCGTIENRGQLRARRTFT